MYIINELNEKGQLVKKEMGTKGNLLKLTTYLFYTPLGKKSIENKTKFIDYIQKFNKKGQQIKLIKYYTHGKNIHFINKYNQQGILIKEVNFFEDGNIDYIKEYNKRGNLVYERYYLANKNHVVRFFDNGNFMDETIYNPQGQCISTKFYWEK